ncbi:MAG TPA: protein kinase domain-containing protein [Candidatus Wunengus sp. YC63]|uniref:protein kinase domain-containing protein n=1 Tax=Candidatus Wunengus sp. YC63 TaxID=3367699 RepID=UPI0040278CDA
MRYSQKRWKGLVFFFFFTGLAIFFLPNSANTHAEDLKVFVFEKKGLQEVPLAGASIFLGGTSESTDKYGKVEFKDIAKGNYTIKITKYGFNTEERKIEFKGEKYAERQKFVLIPASKDAEPLKIIVSGQTGEKLTVADVSLDDKFLGQTTEGIFKVTGSLGNHLLKVEKEGYSPYLNKIEIKEHAETLHIILKNASVEKKKNIVKNDFSKKPVNDTAVSPEIVKAFSAERDEKTVASADDEGKRAKDTSKTEITCKIEVFEETRAGRLPVKDAMIFIDKKLHGLSNEKGVFKKSHLPGTCTVRVEKIGYVPEEKTIELTRYTESIPPIVLRKRQVAKRDYNYVLLIGSVVGSVGLIVMGVIIFTKRNEGKKETIFIDSMGDEHDKSKIQKIHVRFKPFKQRKGMSLIYLGKNPFNVRQKVVFKVLKEEHHDEDGLWLFNNEKKIHQILRNNGANKNQNHLAQYLCSGLLARNKKQRVIVFEYIEGVSLADIISAKKHTLHQAIEMGIWLCDPVMVIHCAGYCQLDLKPEHFIYKGQNHFILIDIATALKIDGSVMTIFKSMPYSSPEQLNRGSVIDQRTDIYSLGVIIEELIRSSTIGYLNSALISAVQGIIGGMKNENRDTRYRHIRDVKASLENLLRSFTNT